MSESEISKKEYPLEPFFNDTLDLMCIAGFDGFFKRVNPSVANLLGYSEEELYSQPIKYFIHPLDKESTWAYRKNLISGKGFKNHENRYLTKEGETVWLSWTSIPEESSSVVYAIAKNITQTKQREIERNELITDLTRINKELKNISYTTSHDLRTPVNNLMAVFSLLDTSKIQDEETIEFINILKSATDGLKNTLNEYVDVLNGKNSAHANISNINLEQVIREVLHSIQSLIKETNTEVNLEIPENLIIPFNKGNLKSVVLNLLTNSIKYAHVDRSPIINIQVTQGKDRANIRFSDNGIGFDCEENADKIFELNQKFHTHDDSKGVGLYLVHNHIKTMGGDISVKSTINEGTIFTITLKK